MNEKTDLLIARVIFWSIVVIIFIAVLYFTGLIECWTGGNCPPVSNMTRW